MRGVTRTSGVMPVHGLERRQGGRQPPPAGGRPVLCCVRASPPQLCG